MLCRLTAIIIVRFLLHTFGAKLPSKFICITTVNIWKTKIDYSRNVDTYSHSNSIIDKFLDTTLVILQNPKKKILSH